MVQTTNRRGSAVLGSGENRQETSPRVTAQERALAQTLDQGPRQSNDAPTVTRTGSWANFWVSHSSCRTHPWAVRHGPGRRRNLREGAAIPHLLRALPVR